MGNMLRTPLDVIIDSAREDVALGPMIRFHDMLENKFLIDASLELPAVPVVPCDVCG